MLEEHRGPVRRRHHGAGELRQNLLPDICKSVKELAHARRIAYLRRDLLGFHFGLGGAQKRYDVMPDMACFGKAMGNGFPIACVVGRADVMKTFEEIFFSFTFGGEAASMAAAMTVLDVLEQPTHWPAWKPKAGSSGRV